MNQSSKFDQFTSILKRALDILFVLNPRGTSLGVFAGIVLHGIVKVFEPSLVGIKSINILALTPWHFIGFGVFAFNIPAYFTQNKIDPKIEEAFAYIRKQIELGTVNDWQAKQMYVNLHSKVLSAVVLNEKEENNRRKLEKVLGEAIEKE